MKNSKRLEKSDKLIVSLATICAALLFSWLIYDVAFMNPLLEGQVEIGQIYEAQNKVKRKFSKSLIWYAAQSNEVVYENDWIFTGADSIAKISLKDGGEIIVEPDSLIVLSKKNGVLQLDLQHGRLMAKVETKDVKINVVRNGRVETVDTSSGVVQVTKKDNKEEVDIVKIEEDKKDDSISDIVDKKYYDPKEGFSKLDANGLSYQIYSYKNVKLFKGQNTTTNLKWIDPFSKWNTYEFQIAADKDFKDIIDQQKTEHNQHIHTVSKSGIYHWRLRGLDEKQKPSSWSKNLIVEVDINWKPKGAPVKLAKSQLKLQLDSNDLAKVLPDHSHNLTGSQSLKVQWSKNKNATQYKFETSDKADFSNILDESIVTENSIEIKNIKVGKTFFRVTPENSEGIVVAREAKGKVQTLFPNPSNDSLETIDNQEHQVLQWKAVPYAKAYEVSYSHKKNDKNKIKKIVKSNRLKVPNKTGFLEWKVRIVEPRSKKSLSAYTETVDWYDAAKRLASLHGTGQAGSLYPVITSPEPRKTFISINNSPLFIVMNWSYQKKATGYDVEISRTPDMKQLVYKKKVRTKKRAVINQKFKPGIYYMRVRARHHDITQESWSESEIFRVIDRPLN